MTEIIFKNWPDYEKDLRTSMRRLVDYGQTYQEAVDAAKKAYLRAIIIKMHGQPKKRVAKRCGFCRGNLNYLMKKYNLM